MGLRGPKPLPLNVHILRGNPSKLPVSNLLDGVHPPVEIPPCPSHLSDQAKKEWRRVAAELLPLGLISKLDRALLAAYCVAWAEMVAVEIKIDALNADDRDGMPGWILTTSTGYQQMSALMLIRNRACQRMLRLAAEFGMSPSTRTRVTASKNTSKPQPCSETAESQGGWDGI